MQFIDLQAQYKHLKSRIDKRIAQVFEHGQYIMGPEVYELEERLSDYIGVNHVITCANGTDALQLALMAIGIRSGDAVLCPTFSFCAPAEAISLLGGIPIFVDSDESTFNISSIDLELKIKSLLDEGEIIPKAIIAVDLFGLPANYTEIIKLSKKYNLKLIEDAAQSFGGEISGRKAGEVLIIASK